MKKYFYWLVACSVLGLASFAVSSAQELFDRLGMDEQEVQLHLGRLRNAEEMRDLVSDGDYKSNLIFLLEAFMANPSDDRAEFIKNGIKNALSVVQSNMLRGSLEYLLGALNNYLGHTAPPEIMLSRPATPEQTNVLPWQERSAPNAPLRPSPPEGRFDMDSSVSSPSLFILPEAEMGYEQYDYGLDEGQVPSEEGELTEMEPVFDMDQMQHRSIMEMLQEDIAMGLYPAESEDVFLEDTTDLEASQ